MTTSRPVWAGSSVDDFIKQQMDDPSFRVSLAKARARRLTRGIKSDLAKAVQRARKRSRLSRIELAKRVRTTPSVIARIENPDILYLPGAEVLRRIAIALSARLDISFAHASTGTS